MVSSAAICLLLSRPRPSEDRSCWYTYIDEHIKPKFEEFGFPLDDNYFYVGKYKDCRLSISLILFNTFTKDRFNYVLDSLYRWIEMTKGELS